MLSNSSPPAATCLALKEKPLFCEPGCTNARTTFALLTPWILLAEEAGWGVAASRLCPRWGLRDTGSTQSQASSFLPLFFSFRCNGLTGGKEGCLSAAEAGAGMNNSVLKKAHRAERPCCPPPSHSPLESHECTFLLSRKGKT